MKKINKLFFVSVFTTVLMIGGCIKNIEKLDKNEKILVDNKTDYSLFSDEELKENGFYLVEDITWPPFPIDEEVQMFYPRSETGHVSSSPFYLRNHYVSPSKIEGLACWMPLDGDEGIYHIVFRATDSHGATAEQEVTFTVLSRNNPPAIFAKYEVKTKDITSVQ